MLVVVLWILLCSVLGVLWFQPRWAWRGLAPFICPGAVYFGSTQAKVVALTIDDGPDDRSAVHPNTTQAILSVLAQYDAHATFFLIGSRITPENRHWVAEMVGQGHEVGNHFMTDAASGQLPLPEFESQIRDTERMILEAAGPQDQKIQLRWLRPGGGFCDRTRVDIAQRLGYQVAIGSKWPFDTLIPFSKFAAAHILTCLEPGTIVILHDHGKDGEWGERTVQTLATILPILDRKGFKVVTLSQLFNLEVD
ncbi:MAG: polysaccharide deacetylase family protein, partial [Thermosynechococcaceae cyanobacterium]